MNEKTLNKRTVFDGRLLKVDVHDVELDGGQRSVREIVRHPGAVAVLAQLPDGPFVFVRQFRKPVEQEVVEIVAGGLEPGEDPDRCVAREMKEETGYCVNALTKLGVVYPAPGYTSEALHLYHATLNPIQGERCPEEDERLDVLQYSQGEVEAMIANGEIHDAKTLAAWMLWERKGRDVERI